MNGLTPEQKEMVIFGKENGVKRICVQYNEGYNSIDIEYFPSYSIPVQGTVGNQAEPVSVDIGAALLTKPITDADMIAEMYGIAHDEQPDEFRDK